MNYKITAEDLVNMCNKESSEETEKIMELIELRLEREMYHPRIKYNTSYISADSNNYFSLTQVEKIMNKRGFNSIISENKRDELAIDMGVPKFAIFISWKDENNLE